MTELLGSAKVLCELVRLLFWKVTRRKWKRIRRLLYESRPNAVITSKDIFLYFWSEALGDIPIDAADPAHEPKGLAWRVRASYRLKKYLMPFKSVEEVQEFMADQRESGLVEYNASFHSWRLASGHRPGKYGSKYDG